MWWVDGSSVVISGDSYVVGCSCVAVVLMFVLGRRGVVVAGVVVVVVVAVAVAVVVVLPRRVFLLCLPLGVRVVVLGVVVDDAGGGVAGVGGDGVGVVGVGAGVVGRCCWCGWCCSSVCTNTDANTTTVTALTIHPLRDSNPQSSD